MKNLIIYLIIILLFLLPLVSEDIYATELNMYNTYLGPDPLLRGPPGTGLYLELTNGADTLRHRRTFPENGIIQIADIFDPTTGIETQYVPSNKDFMEVNGTDLLWSSGVASKGYSNSKVKSVKITNYKGELVSDLSFVDHGDYVTANWDGQGVSNSQYYFVVETDKGINVKPVTFLKNPTDGYIPDWMFDKLSEHNSKQSIDDVVTTPKVSKGSIWDAKFVYTCDSTAIPERQHEQTTLYEQIDSNDASFTPTHWLTPLEQVLDANFNVVNGYDGSSVNTSSVRVLNGEKELIGYVTPDSNGEFTVENLPTDSTYYVEVSDPNFRNMQYNFHVSKRTTLNQVCENAYVGKTTVPDGEHYLALFSEPGDYVGRSNGVDINNPTLDIMRVLEGQIGVDAENNDGRVVSDLIMDRTIQCYNLTSTQEGYLDDFAKEILGGTGFSDYFTITPDSTLAPDSQTYNYIDGNENAGIAWSNTGNTTQTHTSDIKDNYGNVAGTFITGGITESIGELSTYHELMNYMYPESVKSEDSPANSTAHAVSINDPLSVQYKMDVDKAKFQNGWFTGEASDLRIDVNDFKSKNPTNILQIP
ncbi:MAG: carboxypeptidase-like regulatory domain-containing protein [Candidatus Delongbacteria bacterium]|nr:carboxypeptidase-like regulatory domain-containing protein [Candidatus Delongbacteria bacterium]